MTGDKVTRKTLPKFILHPSSFILLLGALLAGCAESPQPPQPAPPVQSPPPTAPVSPPSVEAEVLPPLPNKNRRLKNTYPSVEELVKATLALLETKPDGKKLLSTALTKDEFIRHLWPEFPASKIPNVTSDWAWEQDQLRNNYGVQSTLDQCAGRKFTFVRVSFSEKPTTYQTFRIHKFPKVVVRDEAGAERTITPFGPVLEIDGKFKIYGFGKDD